MQLHIQSLHSNLDLASLGHASARHADMAKRNTYTTMYMCEQDAEMFSIRNDVASLDVVWGGGGRLRILPLHRQDMRIASANCMHTSS